MMAELASLPDGKLRKEKVKGPSGSPALKVLADEEMARRLHEELNGPELSPAAAAVRRSRKAPAFYTPLVPGVTGSQAEAGAAAEAEKAQSPRSAEPLSPKSPFKAESAKAEKAASSAGKKPSSKARVPVYDSAENSPTARHRTRQKQQEGEGAPDAPSQLEAKDRKAKSEPEEIQSNRRGPRETRLRTKDSAQDFPPHAAESKARPDRSRSTDTRTRLTRSNAVDLASGSDKLPTLKTHLAVATESEGEPTPKATASGRLVSDSVNRASSVATSTRTSSQAGSKGKLKQQFPRIRKLPMCLHGSTWYRARKLGETKTKVNLDFPGVSGASNVWLPKDSQRIWTGSYKGKDWKHLGDGAWEPKQSEDSQPKKASKSRKRRAAEASDTTSSGGDISEMDHHCSERPIARSSAHLATDSQPSSSLSDRLASMDVDMHNEAEETKAGPTDPDTEMEQDTDELPPAKRVKGEPEGQGQVEERQPNGRTAKRAASANRRPQPSADDITEGTEAGGATEAALTPAGVEKVASPQRRKQREREGKAKESQEEKNGVLSPKLQKLEEPAALGEPQEVGKVQVAETGAAESAAAAGVPSMKAPASGLEALAIAMADAKGMAQPASRPEPQPGTAGKSASARNRKRAAARAAAKTTGEISPSERSNGKSSSNTPPPDSPLAVLLQAQEIVEKSSSDASELATPQPDTWRAQWNEKHMQRLREVEEEEAAAEFEDLPDDPHEPFPEQALERPMRAVRAPRQNTDATGRTTRDPDGGSPQTPAKRGGRGKGRWANHVKKSTGGRGARGLPIATSQDTPRAGRGGGRGRRGGRGGSRPSRPDPAGERTCQLVFDNLVNALENHFNGSSSLPSFQDYQESCPSILALSPDSFADLQHEEVKAFRMPPPPVPLFV